MTHTTDSNPFVARDFIEEATGIIMKRFDLDATSALAVLRRMSQNTSTQMCVVAAQVINHQVPLRRCAVSRMMCVGRGGHSRKAPVLHVLSAADGGGPASSSCVAAVALHRDTKSLVRPAGITGELAAGVPGASPRRAGLGRRPRFGGVWGR